MSSSSQTGVVVTLHNLDRTSGQEVWAAGHAHARGRKDWEQDGVPAEKFSNSARLGGRG